VSHPIGIDVHDITFTGDVLKPGWIISNEPGLYVDEEEIGIRIEDDLLITEDGCEVLSKDIIKEPDEIEAFMA
jgi:Xaa-Pro aminopeptidase